MSTHNSYTQAPSVNGYALLHKYGLKGANTIRLAPYADYLFREYPLLLENVQRQREQQKQHAAQQEATGTAGGTQLVAADALTRPMSTQGQTVAFYGSKDKTIPRHLSEPPMDAQVDPQELVKGMLENYSVSSLDLHRCGIQVDGAYDVAQLIASTRFITALSLSRNRFHTKGGTAIAEALKGNQTIRHLDLSWNELRDDFAGAMAEALTMNNSLHSLELDRNNIGEDGVGALALSLSSNFKLRYLSLSQNKVNTAACGLLGEGLIRNNHLVTLDLSMNGIPTEGIYSLIHALNNDRSVSILQTLNLSYNRIGSNGIVLMGQWLGSNPKVQIKELNLEMCYLEQGEAWSSFAKDFQANRTLINLSVANNEKLKDTGVEALCTALSVMSQLKYLDLTAVGISASAVTNSIFPKLFGDGNKERPKLSTLLLSENAIGGCEETLASLMYDPSKTLQFVGLEYCKLQDMYTLAKGLQKAQKACEIEERKQQATKETEASELVESPKKDSSWRRRTSNSGAHAEAPPPFGPKGLNLRGNRFKDEGMKDLMRWLKLSQCLTYLDLSSNELSDHLHVDTNGAVYQYKVEPWLSPKQLQEEQEKTALEAEEQSRSEEAYQRQRREQEEKEGQEPQGTPYRNIFEFHYHSHWSQLFQGNPGLPYLVLSDSTILTRGRLLSWDGCMDALPLDESLREELGAQHTELLTPPLCQASVDIGAAVAGAPSQGFATYSITCGSAMKRQLERIIPYPLQGLFHYAGKPVKHLSSFRPSLEGKFPREPSNTRRRLDALATPDQTQKFEQNIGGIIITEDQLRREFNRLDTVGSGLVNKDDFKKLFSSFDSLGAPLSDKRQEWLMCCFNNASCSMENRTLNFEEFCVIYLKMAQF